MGKFSFSIPSNLQSKIDKIAKQSPEIIDKCVEEGAEVAKEAVERNLVAVLSPEHQNGELVRSIGVTPVKVNREGVHNARVGFREPRKNQTKAKGKRSYYVQTNAMIANVLEYGRSGKQKARPFLQKAMKECEQKVMETMEQTFDREVGQV